MPLFQISEGKPHIFFLFSVLNDLSCPGGPQIYTSKPGISKSKRMVTVAQQDGAVTYAAFSGCQNWVRCLNSEGLRWIHQDSKDL